MDTRSERDALRAALRSWGQRRRALEAERDPLVRQALEAGVIKEDIHKLTDLGRTTIDRIGKASVMLAGESEDEEGEELLARYGDDAEEMMEALGPG